MRSVEDKPSRHIPHCHLLYHNTATDSCDQIPSAVGKTNKIQCEHFSPPIFRPTHDDKHHTYSVAQQIV